MTVKRFKVVDIEEELYPMLVYYDGDKELGYDEVCELLNELNNENEQLKYNLYAYVDSNILRLLLSGIRIHDAADAQLSVFGFYESSITKTYRCQYP